MTIRVAIGASSRYRFLNMGYRFKKDETVATGVRRIAREQLTIAVCELNDTQHTRDWRVHQVRKRCKKLRGLLRLARPSLGETYDVENARLRDAGRMLSSLRDAKSIIETYDALTNRFPERLEDARFTEVRRALETRRDVLVEEQLDVDARLDATRDELQHAIDRVDSWSLARSGFGVLRGGLKKTYRRGRKAMRTAYELPSAERLHEWRKRVKYHWYHTRLLEPIEKGMMKHRKADLKRLSDLLGTDHDLSILRDRLSRGLIVSTATDDAGTKRALDECIIVRRAELQAHAFDLGKLLFDDKPGAIVSCWKKRWKSWRN